MNRSDTRLTYLFVLPWSVTHLGGVNQVVINLAREMVKSASFNPIVLVRDWDAVHPIWEEVYGLKIVRWRIRPFSGGMGFKERLAFMFWEWRFRPKFVKFCRDHNVAAVNPHYPGSSVFALDRIIKGCAESIPLILSFHGEDLSSIRRSPPDELAQWRRLLSIVDGIVVCSDDLGKKVGEVFDHGATVHVIHNGLDAATFVAMANCTTPTNERIILNVAKFEHKKGQDVLIRAFAAIAEDYADVKLVLVGATDKTLPLLQELCLSKGLGGRVFFFPDTPYHQVAEFFRRATLFALPSRQEPFGIVLLEAGAFGLPVVASRVGGITEILTDGLTGRLVTPDNFIELAHCLRSLLDSPVLAQQMGTRLQQHVLANFTWTAAHDKYVALVRDVEVDVRGHSHQVVTSGPG